MKVEHLSKLKPGDIGQIYSLPQGRSVNQRLAEMGIREGITITVKNIMPLKGPILIVTGNTEIALGYGTANKIKIKVK